MKISVIVPAFNEEKLLAETLSRINEARRVFDDLGWSHELVVCDNNSTDRTSAIAVSAGAKVIFEPINQIGRARNTGAKAAKGGWLIFVDADSHPSPALFREVGEEIRAGKCLAGGSTVALAGRYPVAQLIIGCWNALSRLFRWAPGSFIFCDAEVFRKVGGFDERLYASEEIDLFQRLKKVARASRRRITILHRHPLVTSARKLHLYSPGEHVWFLLRTLLRRGKTLTEREACHTWYDGRR
jgi:glycosyltransferase involved in cell wall biosynthesis